jgi:alginate O-acetyltransferase complex protein AlgJ
MKGMKFGIGTTMAMAMVLAGAAGIPGQDPAAIRADFAKKVAAAAATNDTGIAGKDGWLFFIPELRYLSVGPFWGADAVKVSKASKPEWADPLPAICDFKKQLDDRKIDLLIVPVPAKAAIYPDKLVDGASADADHRVDQAQADFIKMLNDKGVKTLDLTPTFLQYRKDNPDKILYSKEDTHWSGAGIDVASDAIASAIKGEGWYSDVTKSQFTTTPAQVTAPGDIVEMLKSKKPDPETFNLTSVQQGGSAIPMFDRKSPLLLIGDSHNLIYSVGDDMIAKSSGFPENLAAKIGFLPDVIGVRGSGASPARAQILNRGDNLAGKKMIVWVFTAREFTEGQGWRIVPMKRPTN